jgi:uncharacterized protein YkwD
MKEIRDEDSLTALDLTVDRFVHYTPTQTDFFDMVDTFGVETVAGQQITAVNITVVFFT